MFTTGECLLEHSIGDSHGEVRSKQVCLQFYEWSASPPVIPHACSLRAFRQRIRGRSQVPRLLFQAHLSADEDEARKAGHTVRKRQCCERILLQLLAGDQTGDTAVWVQLLGILHEHIAVARVRASLFSRRGQIAQWSPAAPRPRSHVRTHFSFDARASIDLSTRETLRRPGESPGLLEGCQVPTVLEGCERRHDDKCNPRQRISDGANVRAAVWSWWVVFFSGHMFQVGSVYREPRAASARRTCCEQEQHRAARM